MEVSTKFLVFSTLALLFLAEGQQAAKFDPFQRGPFEVLDFHWGFADTGLWKNVEVWAPKNGTGPLPVVYFSGSLAQTITVQSVKTFLSHVASHGYVIIAPWRAGSPNYTVEWLDPVFDYAEENLLYWMYSQGVSINTTLDFTKMVIMGHSAGNHINVNYLKRKGCRNFVASIHLSPVDGVDPFGIIPGDFCITPGEYVNFNIPTLVVKAGLDPIPGTIINPACAPAHLSNERFYNAMPGNRWFINATEFGHVDFFEAGFVEGVEFLNFCASNKTADKVVYQDFTGGVVVSFISAMLYPEEYCEMLDYIEDPSLSQVEAVMFNDANSTTRCTAQCTWMPEETNGTVLFSSELYSSEGEVFY
ncbi:unnamed protein product [Orchesella dallaii]|uniref:Chlorophyllase n=1 Tax=Orchesella dallaii TaxID=48710 RepID=A0ABP1R282_9HEXA